MASPPWFWVSGFKSHLHSCDVPVSMARFSLCFHGIPLGTLASPLIPQTWLFGSLKTMVMHMISWFYVHVCPGYSSSLFLTYLYLFIIFIYLFIYFRGMNPKDFACEGVPQVKVWRQYFVHQIIIIIYLFLNRLLSAVPRQTATIIINIFN